MAFDPLTLLTLKHRGRSVAVFREQCLRHESLLSVAQRIFPSLQHVTASDVVLMAPIPGYPDPEPVEIPPEIWTTVSHVVHAVTITQESEMPSASGDTTACGSPVPSATYLPGPPTPSSSSPRPRPAPSFFSRLGAARPYPPVQQPVSQAITVSFMMFTPAPHAPVTISELGLLGKKVSRVYELIDPKFSFSALNSKLSFRNSPLNNERTFSEYGIVSGDTIELSQLLPNQIAFDPETATIRKPVIYLYPPSNIEVAVELALTSSWRFSAVHPPPRTTIPPGETHTARSLTWTVTAAPNGTLIDKSSGMEVSYLYWEAKANTNSQLVTPGTSRATTPVANTETFDPAHPFVDPGDSVLLPISKVPSYLDAALKALALHTEARTSFITYWLPDMLKHEYVAMRFIAQDAYERAASLRIEPTPDIVTRVFMLFRGVAVRDLGLWEAASARAEGTGADGPKFWADVVGVDAVRAADNGLFRVLEWGGMEVQ